MLLKGNKIQKLDSQSDSTNSLFPKLSFSLMLSGSKNAGKSSVLLNMLLNKDMLAGKFNRIIWVSPTAALDNKLDILKNTNGILKINTELNKLLQKKTIVSYPGNTDIDYSTHLTDDSFISTVSTKMLEELITEQKLIIKKYGKQIANNVLIVFDDIASETKFWKSNVTQKMIFNSRHYKLSTIYTTQSYHAIPKPIRLNNSYLILFDTANRKELDTIYSENNGNLTFKEFYEMFRNVVNVPFNFLSISYQNAGEFRYIRNFEEFIFSKLN